MDGGSQGARWEPEPAAAGGSELAPVRGAGTPVPAGRAASPAAPTPTVPAAEANRSSRESAAAVGPVSSVVSSYNWPHQSSS